LGRHFLLFPEKEAKSVVPLRGRLLLFKPATSCGWYPSFSRKRSKKRWSCFIEDQVFTQTSAKPTLGVWGLAPSKTYNIKRLDYFESELLVLLVLGRFSSSFEDGGVRWRPFRISERSEYAKAASMQMAARMSFARADQEWTVPW
jgi:hypothetical protein